MATEKTQKEEEQEQEQEFVYSKPLVAFQQNQCGPGDPSLIPTPEENLQRVIDEKKAQAGIEDAPQAGTRARGDPVEKPKPTAAAGEQQANGIRPIEETIPGTTPAPQTVNPQVQKREFHPDPVKEDPKPNQDLPKPQPEPKPKETKDEKKEDHKWYDKLVNKTKYKA